MRRIHVRVFVMVVLHTMAWLLSLTMSLSVSAQETEDPVSLVDRELGLYPPSRQGTFLEAVGRRVVSNLEQPQTFSFQIVDRPEPNAFAFPTGEIFVTRGLLSLLKTEDELAHVLGHEITHVTREHARRGERIQRRVSFLPRLLSVPGKVVSTLVYDDLGKLINSPFTVVQKLTLAKYNRRQEHEADRLGLELAARSGYEAEAFAAILERMEREVDWSGGGADEFRYFASHPTTDNRVQNIRRSAAELEPSTPGRLAPDDTAFYGMLDGIFVGENPQRGLFRGQQFLSPLLLITLTFPDGWQVIETPGLVGAAAPGEEAFVTLGVAGEAADPEQYGRAFLAALEKQIADDPNRSLLSLVQVAQRVWIGSSAGYLITVRDETAEDRVDLHFLWVTLNGITFQVLSAERVVQEPLRETWLSLRPLTLEECRSITGLRLRVATSREGENLSELSERTGNVWTEDYTALINDVSSDRIFSAGTLLKIAREEVVSEACARF